MAKYIIKKSKAKKKPQSENKGGKKKGGHRKVTAQNSNVCSANQTNV